MTTGERIRERRKEIGLSAEKLAEILEVSPATIYRYERGDIEKVPGSVLEPLAKALQTTPAYLMGWDESSLTVPPKSEIDSVPEEIVRLNRAAKKMTPEQRQKLLAMAKMMFDKEFHEDA